MKVYLVMGNYDYEGNIVLGVFASAQDAENLINKYKQGEGWRNCDDYTIEEWNVGEFESLKYDSNTRREMLQV